jgi:hypothetical protein
MHDRNRKSDPEARRGRARGQTRTWRDSYPVLLECLSDGRLPSREEIEILAGRMAREIGTSGSSIWGRAKSANDRRRVLVAAARAALLGRRDPPRSHRRSPLVPRGH